MTVNSVPRGFLCNNAQKLQPWCLASVIDLDYCDSFEKENAFLLGYKWATLSSGV